jgi:hypothetical protein
MENRFVLQESWLGCNGIVSRFAFALAFLFAAIGAALMMLERRSVATQPGGAFVAL